VFGPVWTALYTAIGVVGWRMWRRGVTARTWALHGTQLRLNAAWPFTFFAIRNKRAPLAVITALDALVAAEMLDLARNDAISAAALSPYLRWSWAHTGRRRIPQDGSRRFGHHQLM